MQAFETADELLIRAQALVSIIGIWANRTDLPDTGEFIRSMRKDTRHERLNPETRRIQEPGPFPRSPA